MNVPNIVLAHELDAAWIIALYKAVHGGDPGPEEIAKEVIAAMSQYLNVAHSPLTEQQLSKKLASVGIEMQQPEVLEERVETAPRRPRQYCFKFKGQTICIPLPNVKNSAVAA